MAISGHGRVAIVTGASSGIGEATAMALADAGFEVALGARRVDKLDDVARAIQARTGKAPLKLELDVTDPQSCENFLRGVLDKHPQVHVLINNAGKALGTQYIEDADSESDWAEMLDTNVLGLLRMTRLVLPHLIKSGNGHVVNIGSLAGHEAYAGGSVYCGTKFAVRAITAALRQEVLGKSVRVSSVDPGMVETEFSTVRFHGDEAKASEVYQGMTPLVAEDIADCVVFAVTRKEHVNIDEIVVKPTEQAGAGKVARRTEEPK